MNYLNRDDVRIAYEDRGRPDQPPMLLIHGWCDRSATLEPLAAAFGASHRCVSINLRGHGDSDAPEGDRSYAVEVLAGDAAALCDHLGLSEVVVVGHSLGGSVAVELAARRPDLAAAVVALEGVLLLPAQLREGFPPLGAALRSPAWREVMGGLLEEAHLPSDDPAVLQRQLKELGRLTQRVVAAVPEQILHWDAEAAVSTLGAAGTPVLYVEATGGLADLSLFAKLCPQLVAGHVVGVGHNQMLATPAQTVAMIEGFLRAELGRMQVDNAAAVHELLAAISSGDLDVIDRLVSADFVDHGAPPGLIAPGPEGYKQVFRMLNEAMDMRWELLDEVASGERVALRVRNSGRHVGDFLGIPATERPFTTEAMHVYRVENGVIREHWAVRDDLGMLRQLGHVPGAPALTSRA